MSDKSKIYEYFSAETIDYLVKDDLVWHYKHILMDIFKSQDAYAQGTLEKHDRDDYRNNVHFAGLFHDILGEYYGLDVNGIRNQVRNRFNEGFNSNE